MGHIGFSVGMLQESRVHLDLEETLVDDYIGSSGGLQRCVPAVSPIFNVSWCFIFRHDKLYTDEAGGS